MANRCTVHWSLFFLGAALVFVSSSDLRAESPDGSYREAVNDQARPALPHGRVALTAFWSGLA
jgi:hypothetical protein